jgi:hypothetical protein
MSSAWILHKLGFLQIKINDTKGILIPSLFVLVVPFLMARATDFILTEVAISDVKSKAATAWFPLTPLLPHFILSEVKPKSTNILSTLSPLLSAITAITIFIVGRVSAKLEEKKESKKKIRKQLNLLIFKTVTIVINSLSNIEALLMSSIKTDEDDVWNDIKILKEIKKYNLEMGSLYEKLSFQIEYFETNNGLASLAYIEKIKNYLASLSSKYKLFPQDKLHELSFIRLWQVEGYENIINLKQEFDTDILSIEGYIKKIQKERHRFLELRETRKICMNHPDNSPNKSFTKNPEVAIYRRYDIDTEYIAIEKIEDILKQLGIKIDAYKGADLKDFNL